MNPASRIPTIFRTLALLTALGLAVALLVGCGSSQPATSVPSQPGTIDAANLLQTRCSTCHSVNAATRERLSASQWEEMVTNMVQRGAQLSGAEKAALVDYLAANYGQ